MERFEDEIIVKFISALGLCLGEIRMPKQMKEGLIKTYIESGTVESTYMFIDGKEITEGVNYNPFNIKNDN